VAAVVQAIFAIVLAALTRQLIQVGSKQRDVAETQASHMEASLIETQRAAKAAQDNATAAKESADAAMASIILTHRPRVILRNIDVPDIEKASCDGTGGEIWATNIGNTTAHVIKFDAVWFIGDKLPIRNPYARSAPTQAIVKPLPAGTSDKFVLPDLPVKELVTHRAIHDDPDILGPALYLIGVLKYRDDLTNLRRTGFCRRYDRHSGRFRPVDDQDYEHAD
jgi:hypothetical protein